MSVRTVTNARRVGVRLQSTCAGTHRHARVNADDPTEKGEQKGSWVRQVAQAMEEEVKEDQQELETRDKKRRMEDAKRMCRIVGENNCERYTHNTPLLILPAVICMSPLLTVFSTRLVHLHRP